MAKTATITSTNDIYQVWLEVTEDSTNTAKNYSSISWVLKAKAIAGGAWYSNLMHSASVVINNNTVFSRGGKSEDDALLVSINTFTPGTVTVLAKSSENIAVGHNNDGKKSIDISFSIVYQLDDGKSWSANGSMDLTPIARASTLGFSKTTVNVGEIVTLKIGAASSSFTHMMAWKGGKTTEFQNLNGATTIDTGASAIVNSFPKDTEGKITVELITKNGTETVGKVYESFTIKFPESTCKPSIDSMSIDDTSGALNKYGCYLQNIFKPQVVVGVSWKKGATIKSVKYQINAGSGKNVQNQTSGDTTSGTWTSSTVVTKSGDVTVSVTATDTRGYSTTRTETINVISYTDPSSLQLQAYRVNEDGTANDQGDRAKISFKGSAFSIKNAFSNAKAENTCEWKCKYKKTSDPDSNYTQIGSTLSGLKIGEPNAYVFGDANTIVDTDYAYNIRIEAKDSVTNKTVYFDTVLSSIVIPIDVLYNGRGIGIGKPATVPNLLDVAWDVVGNGVKLSDSQPIYTDIVTDEYSHHAIRYGNGVQICYGWSRVWVNDNSFFPWNGLTTFYSTNKMSFASDSSYTKYAQPFVDTRIGLTITPADGGNDGFVFNLNSAKTHISNFDIGRPDQPTKGAFYYFYYTAIGRWK